ncbi:MAG: hypothetical protein LJD31_01245 [Wolbachia endosymbiont of Menacanthus eurysternus]|nr:hypothetical protein [Wolbachia endosymbiont of Menacanthus eurysternus]
MSRTKDYGFKLNEEIDDAYVFQFGARVAVGIVVGVGAVIGALAGLGLSFTALSPLVIGGVIGVASLALLAIGVRFFFRGAINEFKKEKGIAEKDLIAVSAPPFLLAAIASVATGVCIATAANAVLPGVFATWWAIAAGAGIGAIALPTGIVTGVTVATLFAGSISESVNFRQVCN